MAEMVWCNSCKTVIWASDDQEPVYLSGICNHLSLPCPECGEIGNFDGWGSKEPVRQLVEGMVWGATPEQIYDAWSAMRFVADFYKVKWNPSPDCKWFKRPNYSDALYNSTIKAIRSDIEIFRKVASAHPNEG